VLRVIQFAAHKPFRRGHIAGLNEHLICRLTEPDITEFAECLPECRRIVNGPLIERIVVIERALFHEAVHRCLAERLRIGLPDDRIFSHVIFRMLRGDYPNILL
jgi:hypothetical protein